MHHHMTLTCPKCKAPERAVGRQIDGDVNRGEFICFNCGATGVFGVQFFVAEATVVPAQ